jgi:hypothetical protein
MASVRLSYEETREHALPPVCPYCGGPAVAYRAQHFAWAPPALLLCLFAGHLGHALHFALTRRATVWLPLCQRHHDLARRELSIPTSVLVVLAFVGLVLVVTMTAAWVLPETDRPGDRLPLALLVGILAVVGAVAVAGVVVCVRAHLRYSFGPVLRATEIIEGSVVCLSGVAEKFVRAVERERLRKRLRVGP